jgi:hypothetical protein
VERRIRWILLNRQANCQTIITTYWNQANPIKFGHQDLRELAPDVEPKAETTKNVELAIRFIIAAKNARLKTGTGIRVHALKWLKIEKRKLKKLASRTPNQWRSSRSHREKTLINRKKNKSSLL